MKRTFGFLLTVLLVTGPLVAQTSPAAPQKSPFPEVIRELAGKGVFLLRNELEQSVKTEEIERNASGIISGRREKLLINGEPAGWRSLVLSEAFGKPRLIQTVRLAKPLGSNESLAVGFPLGEDFVPMTWEFSSKSGDTQCDILLYDRRQFPEIYQQAYGINKIPKDEVNLPAGAPLLRVRVLYTGDPKTMMRSRPAILSRSRSRLLVIPVPTSNPEVRLVFNAEPNKQEKFTAIHNLDFSRIILRTPHVDETFQFGSDATVAVMHEPERGKATVLALGKQFEQPPEAQGNLVAFCDFTSLANGTTPVRGVDAPAKVTDGMLVDAGVLQGKALYLGQRRRLSEGELILPRAVCEKIPGNRFSLSCWVKVPWGQLGQNELVWWPYRRGAEGLEKPFATAWQLFQLGRLGVRVNRWDGGDQFLVAAFGKSTDTSVRFLPPGWIHFALTVDGATLRLYTNGELGADIAMVSALPEDVFRKLDQWGLFKQFWGSVAKLRIHDYPLSERRIREMMGGDIPETLISYPLQAVANGRSAAVPRGDFAVDAWSWDLRDFKPETTFDAEAPGAVVVEGRNGGKALVPGPKGILIPPKGPMDLALQSSTVTFWFKAGPGSGSMIGTRGHWNNGFQIKRAGGGFTGVVCAAWNLPNAQATISEGQWHHFAFCFDNYELRMFLDGRLIKQGFHIPEKPLTLGSGLVLGEGTTWAFQDLRILGRMLEEQDVRQIMESAGSEASAAR